MKKYKKVQPGIRKVLSTGNYEAYKTIRGKQCFETFKTIKKAKYWLKTYNPFDLNQATNRNKGNSPLFSEALDTYRECEYPNLEESSVQAKESRLKVFYDDLKDFELKEITPCLLDNIILAKKKDIIKYKSKRYNFNIPLKELSTFFNWYKENYIHDLMNPILKRHKKLGVIKKKEKKDKYIDQNQLAKFFASFDDLVFKRAAIVQYLTACRISEIAGLQVNDVFFDRDYVRIQHCVSWGTDRKFIKLKTYTKTGDIKTVSLCEEGSILRETLKDQIRQQNRQSGYLFSKPNGEPFSYRNYQYKYNQALKKAGLSDDFSATHIMRHSMATETRRQMGTLDAAQSVTGHRDIKTAQIYAQLPSELQKESLSVVGSSLEKTMGNYGTAKLDFIKG